MSSLPKDALLSEQATPHAGHGLVAGPAPVRREKGRGIGGRTKSLISVGCGRLRALLRRVRAMRTFPRVTHDPAVMGGRPCIRGMRVTVGMIVGHVAGGLTTEQILAEYPYLEAADIREALSYAAWRLETQDYDLRAA